MAKNMKAFVLFKRTENYETLYFPWGPWVLFKRKIYLWESDTFLQHD